MNELIPESYLNGDYVIEQPKALSFRDKQYRGLVLGVYIAYVGNVCKILMHPNDEIFTEKNIDAINHYFDVCVGDESFTFDSSSGTS